MTGPVVVGTDGSGQATRAVRWATREAAARGRPLRIVYATGTSHGGLYLSPEDIKRIDGFAEGVLEEAAALAGRLAPAVPVTTALCEDGTTACLLGEAGPDATIVVGSRGRGGFASLLVGSDSLRVAARSPVPVVVVPSGDDREPAGAVLAAPGTRRDRAHRPDRVRLRGTADADMIVVGTRRRSHPIGSPLGRVTHAVLHHARCPVVLVPHT